MYQSYKEHVVLSGVLRGLRLYLHTETLLQVIFGLWERELTPYFKKLFKKAVWFIDVRAGRGEHVIFLLHSKKLKHVIAFEPQISEVDLFKKNLLLNGFQNDSRLEISQKFVGTSTGGGVISLSELTLDTNSCGGIKIDVDGAEIQVLEGCHELFQKITSPIYLIIETHTAEIEKQCISLLKENHFSCKVIKNAWWRYFIPEYRPIPHNRWIWAVKNPAS